MDVDLLCSKIPELSLHQLIQPATPIHTTFTQPPASTHSPHMQPFTLHPLIYTVTNHPREYLLIHTAFTYLPRLYARETRQ